MDVRESLKCVYESDEKRNRFVNAIKWMKTHNHNGSGSSTGGIYQQYIDWHAQMMPETVKDAAGNDIELFDYEATTTGDLKDTDIFKSIKIDGYVKSFEDDHFLNDLVKLRGSLMGSISNSIDNLRATPDLATFNVEMSGTDMKIVCARSPYKLEEFTCTIDGADQTFTFTKGASLGDFQMSNMDIAHFNSMFLPWHRVFIRLFELDLQLADRALLNDGKITLPFWDWVKHGSQNSFIWKKEMMGANSNISDANSDHFSTGNGWDVFTTAGSRALRRNWDDTRYAQPSKRDVEYVMGIDNFDADNFTKTNTDNSFRNNLEGWVKFTYNNKPSGMQLHNAIHMIISGDMRRVPIAPNDPIFFLHHCNIDRLWATWQKKYRKKKQYPDFGPLPGRRKDDPIKPWTGITYNGKTLNIKTNEILYWQNLPTILHSEHGAKGYKYECEASVKLTNP